MEEDSVNLVEVASSLGDPTKKTTPETRELTVVQLIDGRLYKTEVMGSSVWLWGGDQVIVGKNTLISGNEENRGQLVFAAPNGNVVAVLDGWGHDIPGAALLAQGVGVGN